MNQILKIIALNERSHSVRLLHHVLAAMGFAVTNQELVEGEAGSDTLRKVRALQARLGVRADESMLVDAATVMAFERELKDRGLMAADRSFVVTGTVWKRTGKVSKQQRLLAYDLDLRGVAAYRDINKVEDIDKNFGFEFLGETRTGNGGSYRVMFWDWQYRRAERRKADVVVFAVDNEDKVAGRSRMVHVEDYSDSGLARDVDISLMKLGDRTEYDQLMVQLNRFLSENRTRLAEIATSREQMVFTANELDVDVSRIHIAARAELLTRECERLSHELLYGLGRQGIRPSWGVLYRSRDDQLREAIDRSVTQRIIQSVDDAGIARFLKTLKECTEKALLNDDETGSTVNAMLRDVLPEERQRRAFLNAIREFEGDDFSEFWNKRLPSHPDFQNQPELVSSLLLSQQLTLLAGGHHPIVRELVTERHLTSILQLIDWEDEDWLNAIEKAGVPDFIPGDNDRERATHYAGQMQALLNSAFPTARILKLLDDGQLLAGNPSVARGIHKFLVDNDAFDFAESRIHDFTAEIERAANGNFSEVRSGLMTIQRVFQISTDPSAMQVLMENKLTSAHSIAGIPQKNFIDTYGNSLGGETTAFAIHQRASHISARANMNAAYLMEQSHAITPNAALGQNDQSELNQALENKIPNYSELFGSPDLCECEHCRSVYSAAAYFVDLLRFLWRGTPNANNHTPLYMLSQRRPDLVHLPLTCENTNTLIPYIDLANEVMEFYVANDSLTGFAGYDTGETTDDELRANPQNFNLEAYRNLKDAPYPFTLPFHQPLEVIRTYSDHITVPRYETLKAVHPEPDAVTERAIAAESLELSQEEYIILTGEAFDGTGDTTPLHSYYGYGAPGDLEQLSPVREFMRRSGLKYTDLVELIQTRFINPYQGTLDFVKAVFSYSTIDAASLYSRLEQVEAGTLNPANDADITTALSAYNAATGSAITPAEFGQWVVDHLGGFRQVITLFQPESTCDLDTTKMRTLQSIYQNLPTSGITPESWSKMHRFIRLWRKLGWTIHETDLMLSSLGEDDIGPESITKLESVLLLQKLTRRPLRELSVLWGHIGSYGDKSLYRKLFLNRAVQQIDEAFKPDAWGNYLTDPSEVLADHQSALLAAFRITEEDLNAIAETAEVIDGGNSRSLDLASDSLNIENLSSIYRYVVLAKGLKLRITDLCKLIGLFGSSPFSVWDKQQQTYTAISPRDTHAFAVLAGSAKQTGFKPSILEYILRGRIVTDFPLGLDKAKTLQTAKTVRDAFAAIERDHPAQLQLPLTTEVLEAKLSLTFQPEIVARFISLIDGNASFETVTDSNLNLVIPETLADKFTYIEGSGRLMASGVITDSEQSVLKGLANANVNFQAGVDELYSAPDTFLDEHFSGVFDDLMEAKAVLLDHPAQTPAVDLDGKLDYVYRHFIPVLKNKLRHDTVTQHIAALIGLDEEFTTLLIARDIEAITENLSIEGFSAEYFNDVNWNTLAFERVDSRIDFDWGSSAPDSLAADNFSSRWQSYIAPPASGEYTLVVDVAEADEAFSLYLDEVLILEKASGDINSSWEVVTELNASQMHLLVLEYSESSQNAAVRLSWKTPATGRDTIQPSVAYPANILDEFYEQAVVLHRAVQFILGFGLDAAELNHLIRHPADFDNIDFKGLTASHWMRVRDYIALRDAVPQGQASIVDVFALANTPSPVPSVARLTETLQSATAWDADSLEHLVTGHFNLTVDDFKNEVSLNRVLEVMQIVRKAGISAKTVVELATPEIDFDLLNERAQLIKNAVKARYEESDWFEVAGSLSDKLRERQQTALVEYLLTQPAIQKAGVGDADALFEYFLIDVQMTACMETSRIVQANAAVQMFVNRCLLNLESDRSSGQEHGVSAGAIDKKRWEWMKNYRVWEANRKVFLYPENWLEPEWRNDRSVFFRDLESYLVQNDVTERSVEQGFRHYLASLNEVANLDVVGMHQENDAKDKLKLLHVFARTRNLPHKYFYRKWSKYGKWSAWEPVPVDIPGVEDGGFSGVHLIPVVWKERLFLFWPELFEKSYDQPGVKSQTVDGAKNSKISELTAGKYWEVKLGWTEYADGKWSPKHLSKEGAVVANWYVDYVLRKARVSFYAKVKPDGLSIKMWNNQYLGVLAFDLSDIQSEIVIKSWTTSMGPQVVHETSDNPENYYPAFMKRAKYHWASLELENDIYLKGPSRHQLLYSNERPYPENKLQHPFFFNDNYRTYFVRPVDITIRKRIRKPYKFRPFIPDIVDDSGFTIPIEFPDIGPDDLVPRGAVIRNVSGESNATAPTGRRGPGDLAGGEIHQAARVSSQVQLASGFEAAFAGAGITAAKLSIYFRFDKGLEFHTFFHPFSSRFVTRLNQGGLPALMGSDTEDPSDPDAIKSDEGDTFENTYDPNFSYGFVKRHSKFDTPPNPRTAYKENVCFDVFGANSLYNWELFFHAPLYIATRLSKNGKYEEAMQWFHYIFDPTTDEMPGPGQNETARYWKVLPFKTTPTENLESWFKSLSPNSNPDTEDLVIGEWRDNPFDPHLVAGNRPLAYMKHVVIKYVQNLIAWGDSLFRQFTRESVYEALQLYVIANHILGPRPELVPKRREVQAETYASLENKWDDFSNALVELENIFPYSSEISVTPDPSGPDLLGIGSALYFCVPANDKLMESWDTVADRLFKIRHCQDINGVERQLALFAPPIDPAALIQATSQGLSLGSILADLSSPPPIHRFNFLLQKANEFCADVKSLGSALLSVLEKKDAEELSRLRASHETQMLEFITAIRERQILDAKANKENLEKARATAEFRLKHYTALMGLTGTESIAVPGAPSIGASLNADSPLPPDTSIVEVQTGADESLVDSDQSGIKLIHREAEELEQSEIASDFQDAANMTETIGKALYFIPQVGIASMPWGAGTMNVVVSGTSIGLATSAVANGLRALAEMNRYDAERAGKLAGFIRREQEWTLQANLAAREIVQLDKQITAADIRIQIAEKELENHRHQIKNAEEIELFLQDKFTNQELYQWMKEQLFAVYKQSYNLAYDMAKKAEKAYKFEMSNDTASFIQYGYWDNSKQGLAAGEKLQLALRQLEKSYLEENRRELELSKSVSLALLNPMALIELRETGKCTFSLPEELFDLDFPGHYFRRIASVSLTLPCIVGPYTSVNCSLRLLKNTVRTNTSMNSAGNYEHENDEGLWIDDDRFRVVHVPVTSIATSSGQNDSGLFEFSFRDERYLPFEGAGAISDWILELSPEKGLRQFDYSTISDAILHVKYTARENGGLFKEKATSYIKDFLVNAEEHSEQPLMRMFSLRHEFPSEWHRFLHPGTPEAEQILNVTIGTQRFPFFTRDNGIVVLKMEILAKGLQSGSYQSILSYTDFNDDPVISAEITLPVNDSLGGLIKATLNVNDAGLNLEELDIEKELTLKIKHSTQLDYTSLSSDELEDVFIVMHYKLNSIS